MITMNLNMNMTMLIVLSPNIMIGVMMMKLRKIRMMIF